MVDVDELRLDLRKVFEEVFEELAIRTNEVIDLHLGKLS